MSSERTKELADMEVLIERAESELEALRLRLHQEGRLPPDPSDPFDPITCLEIWLAALRGRRAELLHTLH